MELTKEYILSLKYLNITNPFPETIEFVKVNRKVLPGIVTEVLVKNENAWNYKKPGKEELDSEKTNKDKGTVIATSDSESEAIRVAGRMLQASQIEAIDLGTKLF